MPRIVWILPVGLEYDRVLASLEPGGREFYILYSGTNDAVSKAVEPFAYRVREYLESGPFMVKGFEGINVLEIGDCIRALKEIYHKETSTSDKEEEVLFRINVGTSSKVMTIAAFYMAAQRPRSFELWYPRAKEYVVTEIVEAARRVAEAHKRGEESQSALDELTDLVEAYGRSGSTTRRQSGYKMMRVPVIPIHALTPTQEAIIRLLRRTKEPFESGAHLAKTLFDQGDLGATKLAGAKSSVSFALAELVKSQLVDMESLGRRKQVKLTQSGELYGQVFFDRPKKNEAPAVNAP